jgi:pseudaminic acid biosynthesis-associated methylase
MTMHLDFWKGDFGNDYIRRNDYHEQNLEMGVRAFDRMLGHRYPIRSVMEVGSNIGLNLWFLNELWKGEVSLYAVEPNSKAFEILTTQESFPLAGAWKGDVFNLPLEDDAMDLVFTSGVLIHIHPRDLARAVSEIVRVSRHLVLCVEYFSHQPVEVPYRGQEGLLFKRDFGGFYLSQFPTLQVVDYGFLWQHEFKIFDDLNWWLFAKR